MYYIGIKAKNDTNMSSKCSADPHEFTTGSYVNLIIFSNSWDLEIWSRSSRPL